MKNEMHSLKRIFVCATIATTAILLTSCATNPPAWYKAGYSKYETENALAQCEYDVSMQMLPDDKQGRAVNNCMIRQGFRFVDNPPDDPEMDHYVPPTQQAAPQPAPQPMQQPAYQQQQAQPAYQQPAPQPAQPAPQQGPARNQMIDESGDNQWWK
jgi:hypothetical protein